MLKLLQCVSHRDTEIWAWSVSADVWRPALAGYFEACAVQVCCDSLSLSSALSSIVPRRLLYASLWCAWLPASVIYRMSSTVSSASSLQQFWTVAFSVTGPTVWIHCLIICAFHLLTMSILGGTWRRICSLDIRSVSAVEVLHNCALQIVIYLLTYCLYCWFYQLFVLF